MIWSFKAVALQNITFREDAPVSAGFLLLDQTDHQSSYSEAASGTVLLTTWRHKMPLASLHCMPSPHGMLAARRNTANVSHIRALTVATLDWMPIPFE